MKEREFKVPRDKGERHAEDLVRVGDTYRFNHGVYLRDIASRLRTSHAATASIL
jgi:hypothetical protein